MEFLARAGIGSRFGDSDEPHSIDRRGYQQPAWTTGERMTIKKRIAKALRYILPAQTYRELETRYGRREAIRWLRREGVLELTVKVAEQFDYTVQSGPFRGMRYSRAAVQTRHATPNLLGTYERQLYPLLEEAAINCDLIVDIGSAEGYFAVGLARLTGKPVVAFDVNGNERQMGKEMATLNQVDHLVTVDQWCSSATLADLTRGKRALVFCDIDGGEFNLFTPDAVSALTGCDIFIELHGTQEQNGNLIQRFAERDRIILDHPKETAGIDRLRFLGADAPRMATEYRAAQQWLVVRANDVSSLRNLADTLRDQAYAADQELCRVRSEILR